VSPVKYELGFYIPEDGILHNNDVRRDTVARFFPVQVGRVSDDPETEVPISRHLLEDLPHIKRDPPQAHVLSW
jgi:hypothetical protein